MNRPVLRGTEEPITVDVGGSLGNGSVPAGSKQNGSSNSPQYGNATLAGE